MPLFTRYIDDISKIELTDNRYDFSRDIGSVLSDQGATISVNDSGQTINENTAFNASPFASAIRLISNQGARYPLQVVNVEKNQVETKKNIGWMRKNPCMGISRFQWKKMILSSLLIRGVAFVRIDYWKNIDGKVYPDVLRPLPSRYVTTNTNRKSRRNGIEPIEILFNPTEKNNETHGERYLEWLGPDDSTMSEKDGLTNRCLVIRFDDDGTLEGRNPVISSRSVLGVAMAAQDNARLYFQNGGDMTGIVSFDDIGDTDLLRQKVSFYKDKSNPRHRGGVLFTNRPVSFVEMNLNAQEQQLIESRQFSVEEISRLYNIPPQMIGMSDTNWGTGVQALERFTHNYAISPYLKCLTDHLSWTLPRKYDVEFNAQDFHYDDPRTSTELLTKAIDGPFMTPNEGRAFKRLEPLEGGDVLNSKVKNFNKDKDGFDKDDKARDNTDRDKSGKTDK